MHGPDGERITIGRHLRHLGQLRLGEGDVGGDGADGGVVRAGGLLHGQFAFAHHLHDVGQTLAVFGAGAGDELAVDVVVDISHAVGGHHGGDDNAVGQAHGGGAEPAFHRTAGAAHFAHGCACTRADAPLLRRFARGRDAGLVAVLGGGADFPIATVAEVH